MKKLLILSILLFLIFLITIGITTTMDRFKKEQVVISRDYEVSPLTLVLDWEIEKPFNLQVFYLHEKELFSESESIRKNVKPIDKHIELPLSVDVIRGLRLDFGSNPGKIVIKNIEVKANHFVNFNDWTDWRYINIDKHTILSDGKLEIVSENRDPYIFYNPQISLSENTELDVFMREQSKIVEQNAPPEPTTARIVISGKAKKGKLPFEVFLNGSKEPETAISNDSGTNERFVIIEPMGMEATIEIKPALSYSEYKISLSKPENEEKYIKYTSFKQGDLMMIHPKAPCYIASDTPFETTSSIKSGRSDYYEIKWQKVQKLNQDIQ